MTRHPRPAGTHAARWEPTHVTNLDPQPVQQLPGQPLPARTRSVAAPSRWANPHPGAKGAAGVCEYAVWIAGRRDLLSALPELRGHDLACACGLDQSCHREVLLDMANPPADPFTGDGHAVGLTVRRPWASMLLVPAQVGGKTVDNRTFSTDYRGPVAIFAATRIDTAGCDAATAAGLDTDWHAAQSGWLGAAALVDVHPARRQCCAPWGYPPRRDTPRYHWIFDAPHRLALPTFGRGFPGLRAVSWSVLVRRSALRDNADADRRAEQP